MSYNDAVIDTICETLGVARSTITSATPIAAIVLDSMDVIELIAVLQSEYKMALDTNQIVRMETVGDIVRYVEAQGGRSVKQGYLESF